MGNKNIIYGYFKKDIQEYVYIGQTINLYTRRLKHEKYDPYNKNTKEYNYPLSRGIRKYGINTYECRIIEEVDNQKLLDDREKYWIKYYNTYEDPQKYNLTPGGSSKDYKFCYLNNKTVDLAISLLKETTISFNEIHQITGISISMLSEINHGTRRKKDNESYPLRELTRGKKLTQSQINEIIEILKNEFMQYSDIAQIYGVSSLTIQYINNGTRGYHYDNIDYPIRKENYAHSHLTKENIEEIYDLLINTNKSYREIARLIPCCTNTIVLINSGKKYKLKDFTFPLRNK